jgi:hypothetical protein
MRTIRLLSIAIAALAVVASGSAAPRDPKPGPAPRFDRWKILGPGGGGTMIAPTISPHDPRVVVEHCDMTGAYITTDGARSWRMFNLRAGVSCFAFDPGNPKVIYAGTAAVWRSDDAGRTWRMVFPDPAKNTSEHTWNDHAEYVVTTDDPAYPGGGRDVEVNAIAVDPSDSGVVYAVFAGGFLSPRPAELYQSRDHGRSWGRVAEIGETRGPGLWAAPHGRGAAGRVFVATEAGVVVVGGGSMERRAAPEGTKLVAASMGVAAVDADVPTVYATAESAGGVFVSTDGGEHWRSVGSGIAAAGAEPPRFGAVACAANAASTAYVGFRGLRRRPGDAGLANGIAKTTDGGATWAIVTAESSSGAPNLGGSWIEARAAERGTDVFFDAPYSLGVAPSDPNVCYATDLFRTYRTTDGGRRWETVTSVPAGRGAWTTRGLDVTTCYGVHFDPFDRRRVFVTYTDSGLFRSEDGGASWRGSTVGIPNDWRNTTYWVAFDPAVRGLMWGAFSGTHDLPRPKMWRTRDPDTFQGGVAVSSDGGRRWTVSNAGMPPTAVTHILLDPTSPPGRRTLYACFFGRGVYKSTDIGRTWAP